MHRPGEVTLVPLGLLADVDDRGGVGLEERARLGRVDLLDLGLHLLEVLTVGRHCFNEYSEQRAGRKR